MGTSLGPDKELYERHADEAAFLWSQWERGLVAADDFMDEVAASEDRLLAHVDALVLGGPSVARMLLVPSLSSEELERVSSSAYVLLSSELPGGAESVRASLEDAPAAVRLGLQRALEVREREELPSWLLSLLKQDDPMLVALALEVLASHGMAPAPALPPLLRHDNPIVRAAALRAACHSPGQLDRSLLPRCLESPDPGVRDAAIEAGLLGGHGSAWAMCQTIVRQKTESLRLPALLAALGGQTREIGWLIALLAEPLHRRDALWALGFSGDPAAAEACLVWMEDEAVAPLAGEAFCAITGLQLKERFVLARPEPNELPPLEDDLDDDCIPQPEDDLPPPSAAQVTAWWRKESRRFKPGQRYLYGRPWSPEVLLDALFAAPMRRRTALALDLRLRSRGVLSVPVRAFTSHQFAALEVARSASPATFARPFTATLDGV
ncbi:TIGR02270 family protein [Corallococcus terminator]